MHSTGPTDAHSEGSNAPINDSGISDNRGENGQQDKTDDQ